MQPSGSPASAQATARQRSRPAPASGVKFHGLKRWARAAHNGVASFLSRGIGPGVEAPTECHIVAVNQRWRARLGLIQQAKGLNRLVAAALREPRPEALTAVVTHKHRAHDWVQRIEKIWDFYFELFGQRQSRFGPWLLSADRIALDCYQDAYMGIGREKTVPAPPPFCYMRTGFGPATYRRGIKLKQLGRELNPFPLIQLPYHRLVNPWTLGAVHEVSHNL